MWGCEWTAKKNQYHVQNEMSLYDVDRQIIAPETNTD